MSKVKKLVLILAIFTQMTKAFKKDKDLARIAYIYYPVWFKKNKI